MKNQSDCPVIGIPVNPVSFAVPEEPERGAAAAAAANGSVLCDDCKKAKKQSVSDWITRFRMKASKSRGEQVDLGPKITQTVKGKLRFLRTGGSERVFRKAFPVVSQKEEMLLKSSLCYLSTTAGPIAGTLFISTERIAFLSDSPLKLTSHNGDITRFRYKVVIPLSRIKNTIPIENLEMPNKKYIQILTVDEFDFWFMGFDKSYQYVFNNLQKTILGRC